VLLTTKSEQLFEEFCRLHNIIPVRIPECSERQPDYEISFNGTRVIFEIKQIEPNEADKEFNTVLEKKRWATQSRNPDKVAEIIRACPQSLFFTIMLRIGIPTHM